MSHNVDFCDKKLKKLFRNNQILTVGKIFFNFYYFLLQGVDIGNFWWYTLFCLGTKQHTKE
jgi:hypothetical protein